MTALNVNTCFTEFDKYIMHKVLDLAKKGQYSTTPNPHVGCVLVDEQQNIVGQGFHRRAGEAHAEVNAINEAGGKAENCTAYVSLEPCSHQGRTPACALALIKAKVKSVVVACVDPNPKVSGKGIALLEQAGITVKVGLLEQQAIAINTPFFHRMQFNKPYVTVKLAASLDGKTALENGQSKWITSTEARQDVQQHRARACAILTGADTVITDNPSLNVRANELNAQVAEQFAWREKQPLRVVIDAQNRLNSSKHGLLQSQAKQSLQSTLVYNLKHNVNIHDKAHPLVEQAQLNAQVSVGREYINLAAALSDLADRNINHLWVEAGARLTGALFNQGLVDELILYQAPKLLGQQARGLTAVDSPDILQHALQGKITDVYKVGPDTKTIVKLAQ